MPEKDYRKNNECPFRVCGTATQMGPKPSREKVLRCPLCVAKLRRETEEKGK